MTTMMIRYHVLQAALESQLKDALEKLVEATQDRDRLQLSNVQLKVPRCAWYVYCRCRVMLLWRCEAELDSVTAQLHAAQAQLSLEKSRLKVCMHDVIYWSTGAHGCDVWPQMGSGDCLLWCHCGCGAAGEPQGVPQHIGVPRYFGQPRALSQQFS